MSAMTCKAILYFKTLQIRKNGHEKAEIYWFIPTTVIMKCTLQLYSKLKLSINIWNVYKCQKKVNDTCTY